MKNILLCLLVLIVAPAWAEVAAVTPAAPKPMAMQASPAAETGIVVELNGEPAQVAALVASLEKDAVYKEAACTTSPAAKDGKSAQLTCARSNGTLMTFLGKNAQGVLWKISATAYCPLGCVMMNCPPPGGPLRCCRVTNYRPC